MSVDYEVKLVDHEKRIISLEQYKDTFQEQLSQCSGWQEETAKLVVEMKEHNKRSEDALNHNTQSNLLLIASNETAITSNKELAQAFNSLKNHIEKEHDPVIAWYAPYIQTGEDIKGFVRINKALIKWIVGIVITGAAFYTALQTFT